MAASIERAAGIRGDLDHDGVLAFLAGLLTILRGVSYAAIRASHRGRTWLALGLVASIAANIAAQFPHLVATAGRLVSAWPPLARFGTHRLLDTPTHPPPPRTERNHERTTGAPPGHGQLDTVADLAA